MLSLLQDGSSYSLLLSMEKSTFGSPLSSCQKGVSKPLSLYALGSFGMAPQHLELLLKSLGQISVSPSMREGLACVI